VAAAAAAVGAAGAGSAAAQKALQEQVFGLEQQLNAAKLLAEADEINLKQELQQEVAAHQATKAQLSQVRWAPGLFVMFFKTGLICLRHCALS
jgi:hypothetical protein